MLAATLPAPMRQPMTRPCCCLAWLLLATQALAASDREDVLATDAAFAARSQEAGQQTAFLEYLADDGVVFRPGPVPGKDWIGSHEPPSGQLDWIPSAALVDCSGTLAVSTGRWEYSNDAGGEPVAGHYLTVWRHQSEGEWRIVLDHGVDHPADLEPPVPLARAFAALETSGPSGCAPEEAAGVLPEAEAKMNRVIVRRGRTEALHRRSVAGAVVFRDDVPPAQWNERWPPADDVVGEGGDATSDGTIAVAGSDLAISYGSLRDRHRSGDAPADFLYVRVWRWTDDGWRVAIDVQTPLPADVAP
jgi:ketosteroid isomerase-like protein